MTGQKNANNQEGVFPDNTADFFDNPRIEYFGEILRRTRGPGFNVGIVTTADLTDSTPAANAAHTSDRFAGPGIAAEFFDERKTNGVTVLIGGGANHFSGKAAGGTAGHRDLTEEFEPPAMRRCATALTCGPSSRVRAGAQAILGLFHQSHMPWRSTRWAPAVTATNWRSRRTPPTATRRCSRTWRGRAAIALDAFAGRAST